MSIMEGWKPWQEVEAAAERQRQEAECFRWISEHVADIRWGIGGDGQFELYRISTHKVLGIGKDLIAAVLSARQEAGK